MFVKFIDIFENILSCHAPVKLVEKSTEKQQKQWLTKELRGLINEKHRLFKAWRKNPKPAIYNIYKSLPNSAKRKQKKAADDIQKILSSSYQLQENIGSSSKTGSTPTFK